MAHLRRGDTHARLAAGFRRPSVRVGKGAPARTPVRLPSRSRLSVKRVRGRPGRSAGAARRSRAETSPAPHPWPHGCGAPRRSR
ncbi:hypothetical protein [Streptomyces sp. NPDC004685]